MRQDPSRKLASYQAQLTDLAHKISRIGFIARGSVVSAYTTCGTPTCRCHANPPQLHGPYWQHTRHVNGKTKTRRLTPAQAKLYQQWIQNARKLDRIITQMEQISQQAAQLLLPDKHNQPQPRTPKTR